MHRLDAFAYLYTPIYTQKVLKTFVNSSFLLINKQRMV